MIDMIFPFYPAREMGSSELDKEALAQTFYENDMTFVDLTKTNMATSSLGVLQWTALGGVNFVLYAVMSGVFVAIVFTHLIALLLMKRNAAASDSVFPHAV